MTVKVCTRCGCAKAPAEFNKCRRNRDGLQGRCRQCQREVAQGEYRERRAEVARKWREDNAETIREKKRQYRIENVDAIRARDAAYYAANADHIKERQREYAERNEFKVKARGRDYYRRHSDEIKAKVAARKSANPEAVREVQLAWREKNYDSWRNYFKTRDGRFAGAEMIPFTFEQMCQKISMHGDACWVCGGPHEEMDHVKPVSKGGPHCLSNLRPICRRCNKAKFAKWPIDDWLIEFRESLVEG